MSITVKIVPGLQCFGDDIEAVEVNGNTVGQCLNHLITMSPRIKKVLFDKHGKLLDYIEIYVNKETAYPEKLNKSVKDGDELHICIIIGGG